jgi:hypothetical protein
MTCQKSPSPCHSWPAGPAYRSVAQDRDAEALMMPMTMTGPAPAPAPAPKDGPSMYPNKDVVLRLLGASKSTPSGQTDGTSKRSQVGSIRNN